MENDLLSVFEENGILWIEINRPKALNSLSYELVQAFEDILTSEPSEEVRVLAVRGKGGKAFVAGADIAFLQRATPAELRHFIETGHRVMRKIENFKVPSVAIVEGYALGGGLELALACDLIIAKEGSSLGLPEVSLGVIPGFGGTQRLVRRTGIGVAKRMILTAEKVDAAQAHKEGLVDFLGTKDGFEDEVKQLLHQISSLSPVAIREAKQLMQRYCGEQFSAGLLRESERFLAVRESEDASEGLEAFMKKRSPNFPGR